MEIPLIVTLWENVNFSGRRRTLVEDTPNLSDQVFNDLTSSIVIAPGPNYSTWMNAHGGNEPKVWLYQHYNYGGAVLALEKGFYPDIAPLYNFGRIISSVRFTPPPPHLWMISLIPLVVEIYDLANFQGNRVVVVQNIPNLTTFYGVELNDITTSVRVKKGPDYVAGKKAQLFRDYNYMAGSIQLDPGDYPNIQASHGFDNIVSSIKIQ